MPVPSYNLIADSEIDPESPITSSLMFRLRDNWMSVFGIDTTDPAPAPALPPSFQTMQYEYDWFASGSGNGTFTASEYIVSTIASTAIEDIQITGGRWSQTTIVDTSPNPVGPGGHFRIVSYTAGPEYNAGAGHSVCGIHVVYSSGNPTSVRVATTAGSANITLANTWQAVASFSTGGTTYAIQAKARATASEVYLQFRMVISGSNSVTSLSIPGCLKKYVPKAAV